MADCFHLDSHIRQLVAQFGSLRAVARATDIDVGYLSKLMAGTKTNPSGDVLRKLGIKRLNHYTRLGKSNG